MTPLVEAILQAVTQAVVRPDHMPMAVRMLREHREGGRAVAVAVLIPLGGSKGKPGVRLFCSLC
jgi:hypothetical protein